MLTPQFLMAVLSNVIKPVLLVLPHWVAVNLLAVLFSVAKITQIFVPLPIVTTPRSMKWLADMVPMMQLVLFLMHADGAFLQADLVLD